MKNPCGTTRANIYQSATVNEVPVYFGSGVNPVNSPAQFFVAWGNGTVSGGLIPTFSSETPGKGVIWFIDEDEAEAKYLTLQKDLASLPKAD